MDAAAENMKRMVVLDDAWNAQDRAKIATFHKPDVVVYWPGGNAPTRGMKDHDAEAGSFFKTFPDQKLDNHPYKTLFASGDWTTSIARFRGTMNGPMQGADGKEIPATGKAFDVEFCTVARWDDGQIVEEHLFYDLVGFMKQIGLS
jgi:ketosteroid isomerase-like protein